MRAAGTEADALEGMQGFSGGEIAMARGAAPLLPPLPLLPRFATARVRAGPQ